METLTTMQSVLGIALIVAIILLVTLFRKNRELKNYYDSADLDRQTYRNERDSIEVKYNTIKQKYDTLGNLFNKLNTEHASCNKNKEELELKLNINRKKKHIYFELLKFLNENLSKCIALDDIDGITKPSLRISLDKDKSKYIFKNYNNNDVSEIISLVSPSNQHTIRKLIIALQDLHTEDEIATFVGVLKEHGIDLL